ncbi:4-carboxy-4-hydroxy-2-oxoadipate aldolase/oxaloacetate decarboxylase [Agaricicola taiwanensis]|uniref:4-carboxy-4-hydroxy-2-oxoadipate aldolase/oxaloacetate decarboxylase n=1 Tax=Agaricicola taiwanensis TaxID=591372 RepID=UPI00166DD44D|nr:4-carboxy-4-hydroxy-2-oxoadipate aldolase/oxaloacetate decarboxylase [Agaricicola taiwanensis]
MYATIKAHTRRTPSDVLAKFEEIWTSTLCDSMGRHGVMNPDIKPIYEGARFIGSALTVSNYPNDNITTHKAILMAQPGDILVIDEGAEARVGSFGHNMSLQARARGVVGLVTSGCIRDVRLLREEKFPVFSRGVNPRSAQKNTPGSINVPVTVGGIVVAPGDVIVADDDGVAVIPFERVAEILDIAQKRMEMEYQQAADIRAGKKPLEILYGDSWIDKELEGKVRYVD